MIDYAQIKEVLRTGIWQHHSVFFVDLENGDPRPDTQDGIDEFISHKFTSPYVSQGGYEENEGETLTRVELPHMTLSLTCYAKSKERALNLAHRLKMWLEFHGYEYLKENGLIVVSIEAMSDRTTFLETKYEQRVGFDVILRTTDRESREIEIIERIELNNETIGE